MAFDSDDEVGVLQRTFNQMAAELATSRAEIERWNQELEARVAERTRALEQAQAQLVQAQKLAALGQLGAGVAHEINNPLGGVLGHVQLLLAERAPDAGDYEALKHIEQGAQRAATVVQNLLRFSVQRKEPVRTAVDSTAGARHALAYRVAHPQSEDRARLRARRREAARARRRRPAGAARAQPRLQRAHRHAGRHAAGGHARARSGRRLVALVVADSGKGIAPEIKERIFEPFFTTKDDWSNVGLGLSVSYRIVEEHGGRIDVSSEPGCGATFTVYLPPA